MANLNIHTAEGFRDSYGRSKSSKDRIMSAVREVFFSKGYSPIDTPTVEYFDVFGKDIGTTPSNELFKFFDRDGNTLVLRPDFTPSVARAVAMHMDPQAAAVRLCYEGSTFVNSHDLRLNLKEQTQMGVELIGEGGAEADAEIIDMTCEILKAAGLTEFQVSVGENNFFKSLAAASGLDENVIGDIRRQISIKNFFGVGELLDSYAIDPDIREAFTRLPQLFGGREILDEASRYASGDGAARSVERLKNISALLEKSGNSCYVSYDFGFLSKFNYYTGMIMSAFTYGAGEPVAKGGRYDNLLGHFGTDSPAVGMGINIDQLLNALSGSEHRE